MTRRNLFWVLTLVLGFVVQVSFLDLISISGVFPNLILLATVFFAIRGGPVVGEWIGFIWGLLSDVASISIFGSQTFMLTLIGYGVGRLQGKIDEDMFSAQMTLVFLVSVFHLMGLMFFEALFSGSVHRFNSMNSYFQPVYSTMICPLVFWVLGHWQALFYRSERRVRSVSRGRV